MNRITGSCSTCVYYVECDEEIGGVCIRFPPTILQSTESESAFPDIATPDTKVCGEYKKYDEQLSRKYEHFDNPDWDNETQRIKKDLEL